MTEISTVTSSGEYRGREGELADVDDDAPRGVVAREMTCEGVCHYPFVKLNGKHSYKLIDLNLTGIESKWPLVYWLIDLK